MVLGSGKFFLAYLMTFKKTLLRLQLQGRGQQLSTTHLILKQLKKSSVRPSLDTIYYLETETIYKLDLDGKPGPK